MRSAVPLVRQLVDDVVAVAQRERVGVVAVATVERFKGRRGDREVVDEEVLAAFVRPIRFKADRGVRTDLGRD